jgi:hypothetical protein
MHGYKATDVAWEADARTMAERMILLAIAKYAGEDLKGFPSVARIAEDSCMNEKTAYAAIRDLKSRGVIRVTRGGRNNSNTYELIEVGTPKNGSTENGSTKNGTTEFGSSGTPKNGSSGTPNFGGLTNQLTDQRTDKGNKYHHLVDGVSPVQICTSAQNCTHPKKEKTKTQAFKPPELGVELTETAFKDWMTVRKAKHSPLTETAWKHFKAQVVKSGLSVQQAVELCATRGWISINADWQAVKDYEKETDSRSSMDRTVANVIKALGITDDTKEEEKDTVDDWI